MRLTCPNCGAQYEVPDDVIPEAGRDVQCSNCGDTWFQAHANDVEQGDADAAKRPSGADDWQEDVPDTAPAPPAAEDFAAPPSPPATDEVAPEPEKKRADAPTVDAPPSRIERPERREIDPSVASVLREEAEREARARSASQTGLETQTDLGLESDPDERQRAREKQQRMARMRGEDSVRPDTEEEEEDDTDIDPTSRRSLFPDIEEINSSLSPAQEPQAGEVSYDPYPEAAPRPAGGFRRGFLVSLLIAIAALLVYIFANQLADLMPALEGVLADYVVWVDGLRQWLDGQVAGAMLWLDGLTSTAPTGG
ncbi:zinc-ribbon domain-containing protein [Roseovarius arcticus]|uniref:zinc-ribbon domain-containing protein n=1 Tax=Roseovarius arcticus TaxID=2547404 RepID=UPI0011109FBC|nr:zinc-ribbon domain-containing protein [Roseovarius arcticus]